MSRYLYTTLLYSIAQGRHRRSPENVFARNSTAVATLPPTGVYKLLVCGDSMSYRCAKIMQPSNVGIRSHDLHFSNGAQPRGPTGREMGHIQP
jgi:hypothetical protein